MHATSRVLYYVNACISLKRVPFSRVLKVLYFFPPFHWPASFFTLSHFAPQPLARQEIKHRPVLNDGYDCA